MAGKMSAMTETDPQGTSRRWPTVLLTLFVFAVLAGIAGVGFLGSRVQSTTRDIFETVIPPTTEYTVANTVAIETLRDLARLTTVEQVAYVTLEKGTDQGWLTFATGDSVSLFAVARIGAGIDLSKLEASDIQSDPATGVITINLPAAEIQYVAVDNEATHVYDRDTGLFTKGDPQLETEARRAADEILLQQALDAGILEEATTSAENVLTDFLKALGYLDITILK